MKSEGRSIGDLDVENQHRIPVIDKTVAVLDMIASNEFGVGITDVVKQTRISRSTIYRIFNTLLDHGLLTRLEDGRYGLGLRFISLAAAVHTTLSSDDIVRLSHPTLVRLSTEIRETCKLSILDGDAVEVVDVVQSTDAITPSSRIGVRFPRHAGAASKVLMAYGDPSLAEALADGEMQRYTDRTHTDKASYMNDLAIVRQTGVGIDGGEWNVNVHAVAAPIRDFNGSVIAALSITHFPDTNVTAGDNHRIGPLLKAAAEASALLGYRSTTIRSA